MSHKIISEGFIAKQPALMQVGNTCKIEFSVCSKRNVRNRSGEGWIEIPEYVTFVEWGESAQRLAETLLPGREVSVIGMQETSSWIDQSSNQRRFKTIYKVVHLEHVIRSRPQQTKGNQQATSQNADQGYDDYQDYANDSADGNGYAGEPIAPQYSQRQPQPQPQQQRQAPPQQQRQAPPQQQQQRTAQPPRYANQSGQPPVHAAQQPQSGNGRFDACY